MTFLNFRLFFETLNLHNNTDPKSLKSGHLVADTLWAGETSAQRTLFGALLLIKIHTLWQKDFKAKASQVVCEAQQNLQNCGSVELDGSMISCKWWHIWAVLAPFCAPKVRRTKRGWAPLLSAEVSVRHLLLCKSAPQFFFYSLFLCGASSGVIKLKSFNGDFFYPPLFCSQAKPKQRDQVSILTSIKFFHHAIWLLTSDFPWCNLRAQSMLRAFGLVFLTFPLGAGFVYLSCFDWR